MNQDEDQRRARDRGATAQRGGGGGGGGGGGDLRSLLCHRVVNPIICILQPQQGLIMDFQGGECDSDK